MPVIAETTRRGLIKNLAGSLSAWLAGLPLISETRPKVRLPRNSVRRRRTAFKP